MDTANKLMVARWEEGRALGEKAEDIKKYKLVVTKQSQQCKVCNRSTVNNIVITTMVPGGSWTYRGEHCVSHINV